MNIRLRSVFLMLFVAAVLGAVAMPAFADPPGVAGRLSFMQGPVSLQPGGVDDWIDATLNRPLTTSDRVWADQGARAEVSMGNVVARIDQQTSMTITNLDDNITQLELDQGSMFVHVTRLFEGESVEIDTPNVAFVLDRGGDYRFDVDPNNDTTYVSVRRGEGEGTGEAAGVRVRSGEQVVFSGGNSGQNQISELGDMDEFDGWNQQRNDRHDHAASARYVSPGLVGYEDLDDYGNWSEDPNYGPVWRPRVEAGWAPYHTGHWAWIDPWGYTWVDDAPWGYAPFHYGRWVEIGGGWGWCPGRPAVYAPGAYYVRPVYAPALVAFVGGGGFGVGISMGGGGPVGWVPLGWGEPYYPSYHVSETYVRNVNVTNTRIVNITNVTNNYTVINRGDTTVINNVHYANERAVVAVPANAMASGRPVREAAVRVDPAQLRQAKFMAAPPVAPQREAVLGGKAPARQHVPPPQAFQRPVMTKAAPPPPPVRFQEKQQLLQRNNGRPLDAAQVKSLPREQRPAAMPAGKPRPPAAVQQINAAKPKGQAPAAFHPAPARPAPGNAGRPGPGNQPNAGRPNEPANAGRPNGPGAAPGNAGRPEGPGNNRPNEPANAGRPNAPAGPGNAPRPNAPADNAGRPGPGNQPNAGRPNAPAGPEQGNQPNAGRPNNVPRPPSANAPGREMNRPNAPADNGGRPGPGNQPNGGRPNNVPRPPSATPENNGPGRNNEAGPGAPRPNQPQPGRGNEMNRPGAPAENPGRPEPGNQPNAGRPNAQRPPARDANPGEGPGGRPMNQAQPPRQAPEARQAPEQRSAPPAARPAPDARPAPAPRPAPEARPAQPPARDNNASRPPERSAAPQRQNNAPPAKDNKPSKEDNKKDKKDERPQR